MDVHVTPKDGDIYEVTLMDGETSMARHRVRVSTEHLERYGGGASAEALLRQSFGFLLDREPPESILPSFSIEVIEQYFPDYPEEIRKRLAGH